MRAQVVACGDLSDRISGFNRNYLSRRISRAKNFYRESYYATKYAFVVIHLSNARSRDDARLKASPRSHSGFIEVVA
jgi:hypothetical protein